MEKLNLVEQCMKEFGLELSELADKFDIPESTLKTWRKEKLSNVGKLALEKILEVEELKRKNKLIDVMKELLK